jgi:hypothetical protein
MEKIPIIFPLACGASEIVPSNNANTIPNCRRATLIILSMKGLVVLGAPILGCVFVSGR